MNKKYFARFLSVFLALITVLSLSAVSVSAAGVSLNKTSVKMVRGVSYTLKVKGTSQTVKWSTSDRSVATVSSKGKVRAVGAGSAVISAKVGKTTLKCKVTVLEGSIYVDKPSVMVSVGSTAVVRATVKGSKDIGCYNSNINVAKGKIASWEDDRTLKVYITGVKAGTSEVKVYLSRDKTISKTIKVTVVNYGGTDDEDVAEETENASVAKLSYEQQVLYYVNEERRKAGVSPLKLDDTLCEAAKIRSDELLYYYNGKHLRPDGTSWETVLDEVGFKANGNGENIAAGYPSAKDVVNGWMNSEGHRKNILNPDFTKMGVSMSYNSSLRYKYYWSQIFVHPKE